ncbi:MAG: M48 family metalloprotease [Cycloclasticus sp.]|jgi:beta-barrel assembly-enhancing protease|nr:M48 family metalloprotease [Cycloclasticus sp.]MEE4292019.1 M48 family metalloprotease [Cycloclasticus sp.]
MNTHHNITRIRRFLTMLFASAFTVIIAASAFVWSKESMANNRIKLPDIGNTSNIIISGELEKKLGKAFLRSIRRSIPLSSDQEINDYAQQLGDKVAKFSEQPDRQFNFFVVRDYRINAFAGPDANIGLNTGLILAAESESELASVVAHEIAHVTQQHLQRAIETASQMSLPSAAATLAAVVLGATVPGVGPAAILAVQAGQVQKQINFTRSHEAEADRVGVQNLADAGFDPRSMPVFFGRLQTATTQYGQKIPEILLTHPAPVSRISDTAARAEKFPYKQVEDSQDFRLIRMKIRVNKQQQTSTNELIQALTDESKQGTPEIKDAARYGLALALMKDRQFEKARVILSALNKRNPTQLHYLTALALNEYRDNKPQRSLTLFHQARQQFPQSRAVNLLYAKVLLHNGKPQQALTHLNEDLQRYEPTPDVYDLLSIAYGQVDNSVRGFQFRAEYFFSLGLTKDAIIQLEQALRAADNNFYLSSQIENRINQFRAELNAPRLL